MISQNYFKQVELLLQILPYVAKEKCFALKGGTAINLFVRDLPRLSVDIDLTYLPFDKRDEALKNISDALVRIKDNLEKTVPGIKIASVLYQEQETKLICDLGFTKVKVEVNTTMRGHILPVRIMAVTDAVQNKFGKFASIQVVSNAELYGGKICAALDRQHPRDLFDIHQMLENDGFSEELKTGFIAALLSHPRPINEMLKPNFIDQESLFETQFAGMTDHSFSYDDYENTKSRLVKAVFNNLTQEDKEFLISFKEGNPNWETGPAGNLKDMPAIQWKLLNIKTLMKKKPDKHKELVQALKDVLM